METSIGFSDKQDWGSAGRLGVADEAFVEVFIDVLLEDVEFYWRELINRSKWWDSAFLEGNRVVIGVMWRELVGFLFAEDFSEFMVFWGDSLEIGVSVAGLVKISWRDKRPNLIPGWRNNVEMAAPLTRDILGVV